MASFFKGNQLYKQDSDGNYRKVNHLIPTHHWKLQETSGTMINDAGLIPKQLTSSNTTLNQTGKISKAIDFNGSSSRLRTSDVFEYPVGSFSAWVYRESGGAFQSLFSSCRTNSEVYNFNIAISTLNRLTLFVRENTTLSYLTSTNTIPLEEWCHVVVTSNGTETKLYLNGVEETVIIVQGSNSGYWLSSVTNRVNTNIGRTERQTITDYFDGMIEDIRLYNHAISEQEIATIYNAGNGTLSQSLIKVYPTAKEPIHHWKLQEENGTTVNDASSKTNLTNSNATVNQTGKIDKAYSFNGSSSKLTLPSVLESNSTGSISAWIYLNAVDNNVRIILSESDGTTSEYFRFYNYGDDLRFNLRTGGSFIGSVQAESSLSVNTWHNVIVTADGNEYKMYVDGLEQTLTDIDGVLQNTGNWNNATTVNEAYIGVFNDSSSYFDGSMEDIRVYDYALSDQEVKNIYNNGKGLLI